MLVSGVLTNFDDNSFGFRWPPLHAGQGRLTAVNYTGFDTKAEAVAAAQAYIAAQGGAWVLIIAEG